MDSMSWWNFTKFLIDRDGSIVRRFEPTEMKGLRDPVSELTSRT